MQADDILQRVARAAPGAPDEPWDAVTEAAERGAGARIPGSLRDGDGHAALALAPVPAAVLVPILDRAGALAVLLTRRTEGLARHAGQISFPGGRADAVDRAPVATALREAREEVGLAPDRVAIAGRLENYVVGTGYRITPVVGVVAGAPALAPDAREVAEVFEVPLPFVLDAGNYRREGMTVDGLARRYHVLSWGRYRIWGATAAILANLRDVLHEPC